MIAKFQGADLSAMRLFGSLSHHLQCNEGLAPPNNNVSIVPLVVKRAIHSSEQPDHSGHTLQINHYASEQSIVVMTQLLSVKIPLGSMQCHLVHNHPLYTAARVQGREH